MAESPMLAGRGGIEGVGEVVADTDHFADLFTDHFAGRLAVAGGTPVVMVAVVPMPPALGG